MADLNTNLSKQNFDALLHFEAAAQIIKEREKSDAFGSLKANQKKLLATLAFFSRGISDLSDDVTLMKTIFVSDNIIQQLKNMRTLLRFQAEEDNSGNLEYALKLSKAWNGIVNYHTLATSKEMRQGAYTKIGKLIDLFDHFPTHDEHSIGYYLSHYAGENWLPFPFIEILKNFYEEHLQIGPNSKLSTLLKLLSNIIDSFQNEAMKSQEQ